MHGEQGYDGQGGLTKREWFVARGDPELLTLKAVRALECRTVWLISRKRR